MRAINHALTGALLGVSIGNPVIAIPAAVASHFVLDATPHFGEAVDNIGSALFKKLLVIDVVGCFALVVGLLIWQPQHYLLACLTAFLAASPDLTFIPAYWRSRKNGNLSPESNNRFVNFHMAIQWFQRPIGVIVEVVWLMGSIITLVIIGK